MSLRDRLGVLMGARFRPEELPEWGRLAVPLDGGRGAPLGLRAVPSIALLHAGDEALTGHSGVDRSQVDPRKSARLLPVARLAQSAFSNACLPHAIAAVQALDAWIALDVAGRGPGWKHSSDVAWRAMRIALVLSLVEEEIDPGLKMRLADSARMHALFLRHALMQSSGVHPRRAVLQASALVVIGLVWPGLEGARGWWSEGLAGLGRHWGDLQLPDGSPSGALSDQLESIEAAALARFVCEQNGVSFPASAEQALHQGLRFLKAVESAQGMGAVSSFAPIDGGVVAQRAHRLMGVGIEAPSVPVRGWSLNAFRCGGWLAARYTGKSEDVFLHWVLGERELTLSHPGWGAVGCAVLAGSIVRGGGEIERARVDGRRVQFSSTTTKGALLQRRKVVADGARLVVEDRVEGDQSVAVDWVWRLAPGWSLPSETDFSHAYRQGRRLKIGLSKELDWRLDSDVDGLVFRAKGRLIPGQRILNRFELGKG
jgi:hypothetical protein